MNEAIDIVFVELLGEHPLLYDWKDVVILERTKLDVIHSVHCAFNH